MINMNDSVASLVRVTSNLIGYRLSTLPTQSGTRPSVIQNRYDGSVPNMPYATVDHIGLNPVGYAQSDDYLDDNFDQVDEFDYIGSFTVQINGSNKDDALGICSELRERLFTNKGKRYLRENFSNAKILSVSEITFLPSLMVTDFEEAARITIRMWMRSVLIDPTTDVIEHNVTEGDLMVGDELSLEVNTDTRS